MLALMFKLLCGHAFGDYALQSDFIANNKGRPSPMWPYVLSAHALIHGAFVYLATGSVNLGIAETIAHAFIDFGKCEKYFGIHADQLAHIACKVVWMYFATGL